MDLIRLAYALTTTGIGLFAAVVVHQYMRIADKATAYPIAYALAAGLLAAGAWTLIWITVQKWIAPPGGNRSQK